MHQTTLVFRYRLCYGRLQWQCFSLSLSLSRSYTKPSFSKARQEQDKLLPFARPLAATVPSSSLFAHEVPYWSGSSYSAPGCPSHTTSGLHTAKLRDSTPGEALLFPAWLPCWGCLSLSKSFNVCSNVGFPHASGSELLFIFCLFFIKFY